MGVLAIIVKGVLVNVCFFKNISDYAKLEAWLNLARVYRVIDNIKENRRKEGRKFVV